MKIYPEKERRRHAAAWRKSDLTQQAYSRKHGLSSKTLSLWSSKYGQQKFAAVKVVEAKPQVGAISRRIEIIVNERCRVLVESGIGSGELVEVLKAVALC